MIDGRSSCGMFSNLEDISKTCAENEDGIGYN